MLQLQLGRHPDCLVRYVAGCFHWSAFSSSDRSKAREYQVQESRPDRYTFFQFENKKPAHPNIPWNMLSTESDIFFPLKVVHWQLFRRTLEGYWTITATTSQIMQGEVKDMGSERGFSQTSRAFWTGTQTTQSCTAFLPSCQDILCVYRLFFAWVKFKEKRQPRNPEKTSHCCAAQPSGMSYRLQAAQICTHPRLFARNVPSTWHIELGQHC